jgi:regulatory protein
VAKTCLDKALELLARRAHFRRELDRKLVQRGYGDEEREAALARVEELGYLDELETARAFLRERLRRGPEGKRRLEAELVRRGAEAEAAAQALAEMVPEDDREPARAAARTLLRRGAKEPAAVGRFLERKGFSPRAIFAVLDELRGDSSDPGDEL